MTDITEFGLAQLKPEGACIDYSSGKETPMVNHNPSETRWIELCYDPKEDMSHIDIEPFREVFQTQQLCNSYTEDDIYLIIKAIANEFVED